MAAIILICAMFVGAAILIIAGVALLAGGAWALITAGIMLFGAAVALRSGVRVNG